MVCLKTILEEEGKDAAIAGMRIVDIEAETPKNRFKKASTTSPAILFCLP